MPLFGSSKRARAVEDVREVTCLAELKAWITEREDKNAALLEKIVAKMDRICAHVIKVDGACDKHIQLSVEVTDQLKQVESQCLQGASRTEEMTRHVITLTEEVRHLKSNLGGHVPKQEIHGSSTPDDAVVEIEEVDFDDMSIRDLNDAKIEAISDLASGSDAMRHKSRHALERELLTTRSALRRALEEVKMRENQVGALEMMSRHLREKLQTNKAGNNQTQQVITQASWGLGMFPPTPASGSLSGFAGALGGSFTGRPQKPMNPQPSSTGAHTERTPLQLSRRAMASKCNESQNDDQTRARQLEQTENMPDGSRSEDVYGGAALSATSGSFDNHRKSSRQYSTRSGAEAGAKGPKPEYL